MQVTTLQKEVADINKQIIEAERMLKFADPGTKHRLAFFALCQKIAADNDGYHLVLTPTVTSRISPTMMG